MNCKALLAGLWGLALAVATATPASAQTNYTWNGGGANDNWSTAANWVGGTLPLSDLANTRIILDGTTRLTNTLDLLSTGGTFDVNGLTYNTTAGAFVVNPAATNVTFLRIGGNGVTVSTNANQTFAAPVILGAAQTWTNSGTGIFTLSGGLDTAGNTLTVAGAGTTRLTGPITGGGTITQNSTPTLLVSGTVSTAAGALTIGGTGNTNVTGVISGSNGVIKAGTGTVNFAAANTFSGPLTVNAGVLSASRTAAGASTILGTGAVTLGGGTLRITGTNATPRTLTGYNHDLISSATDFFTADPFGTSASLDNLTGDPNSTTNQYPGFVFFEQLGAAAPTVVGGIPTTAATTGFVSAANPLTSYRLAAFGASGNISNNSLLLSNGATNEAPTTGSLNIAAADQGQFQTVSVLVTGGGGAPHFNATLRFSDGTTTVVNGLQSPDWFNGANFAITNLNRMTRNGFPEAQVNNPRMYGVDIALSAADQAKTLVGIDFSRPATRPDGSGNGGRPAIFGLSAAPVGGVASYTNAVTVTANSTIELVNSGALGLGALNIGAFTLTTTGPATAGLTFTGTTLTGNPAFTTNGFMNLNPGAIDYGSTARTITKAGNGTLTLGSASANATATNTLVANAGTVNITNTTALGSAPNLTVGGATVNTGGYTALNNLTVNSGTANLASVNAVAALSTTGGTSNFTVAPTIPTATINGGTTNFNAGGTITTATVNAGTVNVNGATSFATFAGTGGAVNVSGTNVLTVGSGNTDSTFGGSLAGSGTLTKVGTGTQTFTGIGSNTGGLAVTAGQVTATRPGALGTGAVTLSNGTTLAIGGLPGSTINGFNTTGTNWTLNGGPTIANDVLTITTNAGSLARSAYFNTPLATGSFTVQFDYANGPASGNRADGFTFVIQNESLTAVGGAGGSLGYGGTGGAEVSPSAALLVNIFTPNTRGLRVVTNGTTGGPYTPTGSVDVGSGATVRFNLTYDATTQQLNVTLTQGANTFNLPAQTLNLTGVVGANAFVGFTGGTGGETAEQRISNFTFNLAGSVNPPISTYANAVNVAAAATATLATRPAASNVTTFTMGNLGLGAGSTLNVQAEAGSLANTAYTLNLGATTIAAGTGTLNVLNNGSGTGTVALGGVSGAGGNLVKAGPGVLVLGATTGNTYDGTTTVQGGTLRVTGTVGAGGAVAVQTGATLSGTGSITRPVTVQTGGTVQGGLGLVAANQALTTGNLTFNNGGTLRTVVSSAGGASNTTATGASVVNAANLGVDATASVMNVLLINEGGANSLVLDGTVTYTRRLATYSGTLQNVTAGTYTRGANAGPFNVTGQQFDPGAWSINVNGGFVDLTFTPVPEPVTMIGVAAVGFGLAQVVRRVRARRQATTA